MMVEIDKTALASAILCLEAEGSDFEADGVRRAVARIAELEAAQAWRPIESAEEWLAQNPEVDEVLLAGGLDRNSIEIGRIIDFRPFKPEWVNRNGDLLKPSLWKPLPNGAALKGGE